MGEAGRVAAMAYEQMGQNGGLGEYKTVPTRRPASRIPSAGHLPAVLLRMGK